MDPLTRPGDTVEKEKAVVAVRDPDAGTTTPREIPLGEALRDFEHVVERAIANEHILPADRELVRRYLEALRRESTR